MTSNNDIFEENYLKGYEYETLMNALHVSVFKCKLDENFTAIWCNNYFFESTGYTKEEYTNIYQFSIRKYFSVMSEEYNKIAEIVMDAMQEGLPGFECVSKMPRKDGTFMWIKVVGTFTNEIKDGIPVLYVVYTDVTDVIAQQEISKRLEERSEMLRVALDAAEQANNAKSDFLSRMSHDIRTPLNAIIGMTEIAEAHLDDPAKIHDCHRKITLSSQHLLGLVNDVLDMSKIESGKMTLSNNEISLPELIRNISAIMQPDIKSKNQRFAVHVHDVQTERICSDALRLRQIFLNILSNASKFTPEGGMITFDIKEITPQYKGIIWMQFTIIDTGIGMREEFLEHIFDTFTREQDSRVDKTVGSGLGMAITKKIVELLNGKIYVSSTLGAGTTFEVQLPMKVAETPDLVLNKSSSGLNVLFVDEDPCVCESTSLEFKKLGINGQCIYESKNLVDIIAHAYQKGNKFDVVFLDWEMKDVDANQLMIEINHELGEEAPQFIAMAYDWDNAEKASAIVSEYLTKPLFSSTICEGLNELNKEKLANHKKKEKTFDFTGKRFLLAEDNELNREIAIELLSATGAQIDHAYDGSRCVEMFEQSPLNYYDLILMDIQMPVMNGYTAAKTIRILNRADAKTVQIWAMTADAFVEDFEKAKAVGMNGHFAKPLDILAINTQISQFLKVK